MFPSEEREYHTPSSGVFFEVKKVLYKKKSPFQRIEVIENESYGKVLLLDGLVQTTERDEFFYHEMLVHPAFVSHPYPQKVLIIGGGDGGVLKEVLRYPIQHVSLVEIDQQVIEVSKECFPWFSPSLKDERVELVIGDGNEFIEKTSRMFDLVLVDSSDPVGPSTSLHEKDFHRRLKRCLNREAIVIAQVGSPIYHQESIKKKRDFLQEIYKVVRFYLSPVPTYPGGFWAFVFLSVEVEPLKIKRDPPQGLKYFNRDIYQAAFALPNFLKEKLESSQE